MPLLETATLPYIVFIASALLEQYFFMMQRSALEISRAQGVDVRVGRRMLPLWYGLVWPVTGLKWAAAIYIGMHESWLVAATLMIAAFMFSVFVPIPHRQFIPVFRRKLAKEIGDAINSGSARESKLYAELYRELFEASKDSRFI